MISKFNLAFKSLIDVSGKKRTVSGENTLQHLKMNVSVL